MKRLLLCLSLAASFSYARAQNSFPASGNVGVGTTTPTSNSGYNGISTAGSTGGFVDFYHGSTDVGTLWGDQLGVHLGSASSYGMQFTVGGYNSLSILANGAVGIGTTSPGMPLQVNGNTLFTNGNVYFGSATSSGASVLSNDQGGAIELGNSTTTSTVKPYIDMHYGASTTQDFNVRLWNDSNNQFKIYTSASTTPTFTVNGSNVGIGTTVPDAALTVMGTVHAKQVNVDVNVPGPDYVFEKSYKLRSLEEVSRYVTAHKHLPEVPSAKEMAEKGIDVTAMNLKLLQKVEELTLYMVKKDKEQTILKQQLIFQQKQIKQLTQQMANKLSKAVNK